MYRAALVAVAILVYADAAEAQPSHPRELAKRPLIFYLARGDDNACGVGCSEWIAAEGNFDFNSTARFHDFMTRFGRRNLPIFFNSPGGASNHAFAIGRFMRERGMTAGVAKTTPEVCAETETAKCEAAKKSGKETRAEWSSIGAQCSSSCVYALLGARVRLVPPGSLLAVHAEKAFCSLSTGALLDGADPRCPKKDLKAEAMRYVRQMGADPDLVELAFQTPHENFRLLSRDEIIRFRIVRDQLNESPWMILREENLMVSFIADASDPTGATRQAGAVALGCRPDGRVLFIYFRPGTDRDGSGDSLSFLNGDNRIDLNPAGSTQFALLDPDKLFHRYAVLLPQHLVGSEPFLPKIEIRNWRPPEDPPSEVLHATTAGFKSSWSVLERRCKGN